MSAEQAPPLEFDEAIRDAVCSACYDVLEEGSACKWHDVADRVIEEVWSSAAQMSVAIEQREIERAEKARRVLSLAGAKKVLLVLRSDGHSHACLCSMCRAARMVGHSYGVGL